ncbi:Hyaluronan-mediated motility receptor C-terminal [Trinorchestia longiramus]|nr:Hyaluronan-mediated motility receptor C-terminal [Trinorchestia longiramus]
MRFYSRYPNGRGQVVNSFVALQVFLAEPEMSAAEQDLKKKSAAIEESKECIEVLREERRCALETQEQLQSEVDERLDQVRALRLETEELRQKVSDQESTITQANECIERHISSIAEERLKAAAERQLQEKQYVEKQETLVKENEALEQRVRCMQEQLELIVEVKDNFALKMQTLEQEVTELNIAKQNAEDAKAEALLQLEQFQLVQKQLENYEAERNNLLISKTAAEREVEELSLECASLLGHQNHKQKIQHVVKIKSENIRLQEEGFKLRAECEMQRKTIRRLEERLGEYNQRKTLAGALQGAGKSNKENSDVVTRLPLRPNNV